MSNKLEAKLAEQMFKLEMQQLESGEASKIGKKDKSPDLDRAQQKAEMKEDRLHYRAEQKRQAEKLR